MPKTDDTMRCALKPLRRADYAPVVFTDAQWAELHRVHPKGVCDFTKPGEDRVRTTTWQTYQDEDGKVIYGGRGLGAAPSTEPLNALGLPSAKRCASRRSFRINLRGPRGQRLRSARVVVNGRRVAVRRGRRLTARVNLRGLPRGTVRVRIVATTRAGRRVVATRRYKTCVAPRRRG